MESFWKVLRERETKRGAAGSYAGYFVEQRWMGDESLVRIEASVFAGGN